MLGRVSNVRWDFVSVVIGLGLAACGGTSEFHTDRTGGGPSRRVRDVFDAGVTPPAPDPDPPVRMPPTPRPDPDRLPPPPGEPFFDPGCPEVPGAVEDRECDPLGVPTGCGDGLACFPYVDYPNDPCAPERFGSRCDVEGVGMQGDECSLQGCAGGFLCVATGQGTQCAKLCELPSSGQCPPGLVCGSVDIEGYGVCF